jgi:bidirectional [NiFe] hydrogenase diaphorase subunit
MLDKFTLQHEHRKDALLEILHYAQEIFGYLDKDLLTHVSVSLNLPPSHVYGVATFYNFFKFKKPGSHVVTFCLGTACFVKGVEDIISTVENEFGVKRGETSADGKLSLYITRCIGACAMAPNSIVDDAVVGRGTPEAVVNRIKSALGEEKVEAD